MVRLWMVAALVMALALVAACGGSAGGDAAASEAPTPGLELEAANAEQAVPAGAEAVFDLKMVNITGQPLSVVVVLEHADGQRWRTSLCVDKQCLLGDGTEPSVSEPVALSPYVEQVFKVQLFVDPAARAGQRTALTARVEPQGNAASPRSVTLRAQVAAP